MPSRPSTPRVPLIIAGMHRSGTSLTTGLLQQAGLHVGMDLMTGHKDNQTGHFENLEFYRFHKAVLRSQGISEEGWTLQESVPVEEPYITEATELIEHNAVTPYWGWKDPRTVLFLEFWANLLPNSAFLMVYRSPWEVVDSLYRRGDSIFQKQPELAVKIWLHYNRKLLNIYKQFSARCLLVNLTTITASFPKVVQIINERFCLDLKKQSDFTLYQSDLLNCTASETYHPSQIYHYFPEAIDLYDLLEEKAWRPKQSTPDRSWRKRAISKRHQLAAFEHWKLLRTLEGQNQTLTTKNQHQSAQIEQIKAQFQNARTERQASIAEVEAFKQQFHQAQVTLQQKEIALAKIEHQLQQLQTELEEVRSQQQHTQEQLKQTELQSQHFQTVLEEKQTSLNTVETHRQQLQTELEQVRSQQQRTQDQLKQAELQSQHFQTVLEEKQVSLNTIETHRRQLQNELEQVRSQQQHTQEQLKQTELQSQHFQTVLEEKQVSLNTIETHRRQLQNELEQVRSELEQSQTNQQQTQRKLLQTQSCLNETEAILEQSQSELHQSLADLEVSQTQMHETQILLQQFQFRCHETAEQLEHAELQLYQTKDSLTQLQEQHQEAQDQLEQTMQQLEIAKVEFSETQSQFYKKEQLAEELQAQLITNQEQAELKLQQMREEITHYQVKLQKAEDTLNQSQIELEGYRYQIARSNFQTALAKKKVNQENLQYQLLVWDAWHAYRSEDPAQSVEYLKQSLHYTTGSRSAAIAAWIKTFDRLSREYDYEFDVDRLIQAQEWQLFVRQLMTAKKARTIVPSQVSYSI